MSRVSGKPYSVYILWSASARKFYIGISEDSAARLLRHNSGASKWTAPHAPWEIVHVEHMQNYSEARKRELLLKRQKGGAGFYKLTGLDADGYAGMRQRSDS